MPSTLTRARGVARARGNYGPTVRLASGHFTAGTGGAAAFCAGYLACCVQRFHATERPVRSLDDLRSLLGAIEAGATPLLHDRGGELRIGISPGYIVGDGGEPSPSAGGGGSGDGSVRIGTGLERMAAWLVVASVVLAVAVAVWLRVWLRRRRAAPAANGLVAQPSPNAGSLPVASAEAAAPA